MSRLMQTIALVLLGLAILIVIGSVWLGAIAAPPMRLGTSHAKLFELLASENPLARVEDVELTASDAMLLRGTTRLKNRMEVPSSSCTASATIASSSQDLPDCSWRMGTEYCL
jgi:hypothetical protein